MPFRPRNFDKVPAEVKDPKGYHIAQRLNLVGMVRARRTRAVAAAAQRGPTSPTRNTRASMVMADPSYSSQPLTIVGTLSKKHGWQYFQKLRANDIMVVQSNQQVSDMIKRGERVIAVEAPTQYAWATARPGTRSRRSSRTTAPSPFPRRRAVIKGAPHPNAAKALAEFMMATPCRSCSRRASYSARTDVPGPAGNPPLSADQDASRSTTTTSSGTRAARSRSGSTRSFS